VLDVDFAGFAGEVEGDIAAGYCDRAQNLVASYHGSHDTMALAADVLKCTARTAAANAGRAADLIGHPPALAKQPTHHEVPADAGVDAPAELAPDPQAGRQFDAFLMNGRCTAAAKIIGKAGATPDREARLADCKSHLAEATHHPEQPDAEKYIVGLAADSPIAQGKNLEDNLFYRAVTYDCDHGDDTHARIALKYLSTKRDAAIQYCAEHHITIP
jgi:hypothetical protein